MAKHTKHWNARVGKRERTRYNIPVEGGKLICQTELIRSFEKAYRKFKNSPRRVRAENIAAP